MDSRPICTCKAYPFPHRIGGKCKGEEFIQTQLGSNHCQTCNCDNDGTCEVLTGQESIKEAECYQDFCNYNPGGYLLKNDY